MDRRRAWLGAIVVAGSMVLAACSSGSSTTSAASSSAPPSTGAGATTSPPATTGPGANPGGSYCTALKTEKADVSKMGQEIGTAIASKDFATTKTTLATFFSTTAQALVQVEATMTGAPADVRSELGVVNRYFSQLQSTIGSATSMKQLGLAMANQADSAQLKTAGQVLDAYTKAQCGDLASPTP